MNAYRQLQHLRSQFRAHPATRNRQVAAWVRFVYWQVRSRLVKRPMAIRFINGSRLLVWRGRPASTSAWYFGLADFDEMTFIQHLLRPGDLFLDGGANVGVWSVLAASTGASVLAVEPIPETADLLRHQGELNGLGDHFKIIRCALSDSPGTVLMTENEDVGNRVVLDGHAAERHVTVTCQMLDEVCKGCVPVLIKLDLEGHELAALRGATRTLAEPGLLALVIETFRPHNWQSESLRSIETLLESHGFLPQAYDPVDRSLVRLREPSAGGQNTIYTRDGEEVAARLRDRPRVS